MKIQTIKIDFTAMLYAGILYTGLVISGWLLIRLTIACFKLPSILNAADESKNKTKRTSTIAVNEDLSSVQYFDTLTQHTCNDLNILKHSVVYAEPFLFWS
ncbi:uncharacterized protein LOC113554718 [Rhopalosiphum maidis]|uniref:uncharacterized protein LOC113554718 n=1 Tax=Rhopalosiphum maidis TaxID=43146 RepID=UPI000F010102|nr:uncharacterized protein LOC113554718 [Rhopalosiphum maidis]